MKISLIITTYNWKEALELSLKSSLEQVEKPLEIIVADEVTAKVVEVIGESAKTGRIGDGKIFVTPVDEVVRIRTGETGDDAL